MDLRILLWADCNRNCKGCCNQAWDLEKLPKATLKEVQDANMVILTGGEPMLYPEKVRHTMIAIRTETDAPIYVYTAKVNNFAAMEVLMMADGLTVTLHTQGDVEPFMQFAKRIRNIRGKSLRLNIIEGVELEGEVNGWQVKRNIKWREDGECPLPPNEIFRRL